MNNTSLSGNHARRVVAACVAAFAALFLLSQAVMAASWKGIEPLKSKREDVERILGKPITDQPGKNGTLHFKIEGGTATVVFVDSNFVTAKKLSPELEGTVRQIVLQHENSNDTPESMGLADNSDFKREDGAGGVTKYTNLKDGIVYTFIGGKLKTTYYTPSSDQWAGSQKYLFG